ncbi:unnamed protein product, partial [Nesidiocoris tenuis]
MEVLCVIYASLVVNDGHTDTCSGSDSEHKCMKLMFRSSDPIFDFSTIVDTGIYRIGRRALFLTQAEAHPTTQCELLLEL